MFVEFFPVEFHFSHLLLYDVDCLRFQPIVQIMDVWRDGLWAILIVLKRHAQYSTFVGSTGNTSAGDRAVDGHLYATLHQILHGSLRQCIDCNIQVPLQRYPAVSLLVASLRMSLYQSSVRRRCIIGMISIQGIATEPVRIISSIKLLKGVLLAVATPYARNVNPQELCVQLTLEQSDHFKPGSPLK